MYSHLDDRHPSTADEIRMHAVILLEAYERALASPPTLYDLECHL